MTSLRQAGEQYDSTGARRRVLVVLSDMLHCVPHSLCLDRSDFKGVGARWFANERANGALASLHDVCVTVVGAEQANGRDANVREFWRTYFEAAGANLAPERYRYAPETVTSRDCSTSQQFATR